MRAANKISGRDGYLYWYHLEKKALETWLQVRWKGLWKQGILRWNYSPLLKVYIRFNKWMQERLKWLLTAAVFTSFIVLVDHNKKNRILTI